MADQETIATLSRADFDSAHSSDRAWAAYIALADEGDAKIEILRDQYHSAQGTVHRLLADFQETHALRQWLLRLIRQFRAEAESESVHPQYAAGLKRCASSFKGALDRGMTPGPATGPDWEGVAHLNAESWSILRTKYHEALRLLRDTRLELDDEMSMLAFIRKHDEHSDQLLILRDEVERVTKELDTAIHGQHHNAGTAVVAQDELYAARAEVEKLTDEREKALRGSADARMDADALRAEVDRLKKDLTESRDNENQLVYEQQNEEERLQKELDGALKLVVAEQGGAARGPR